MNKNNPVSDGYIKEELFMVFLHGKLRDSVDISKVIAAEQFSYILKLFHVTSQWARDIVATSVFCWICIHRCMISFSNIIMML